MTTNNTTTININQCDECYAVPGKNNMIDVINPITGLSWFNDLTLEEIRARNPEDATAERMKIEDYCAQVAARQRTPINWTPTTEAEYIRCLEVLPPAEWISNWFLMGEAINHAADTGEPMYSAFRHHAGRYETSTRAITSAEMKKEMDKI